jgi:hypothetical protein
MTKPSRVDLAELQTKYGLLFSSQLSIGYPISVLVASFDFNNMTPTEKEIGAAIVKHHNRKSTGPLGMQPGDLKKVVGYYLAE